MKKSYKIIGSFIIFVSILLYWNAGKFSGDGTYEKDGVILVNDSLTLPSFPLDKEGKYSFNFKNMKASNSGYRPRLTVKNNHDISYWDLETKVKLDVLESNNTIYSFGGPLNAHYNRIWNTKKNDWPSTNEWLALHKYDSKELNNRAIPFDPNNRPLDQLSMQYIALQKTIPIKPRTSYSLEVTISNPDSRYNGLTGQLSLSSGWK